MAARPFHHRSRQLSHSIIGREHELNQLNSALEEVAESQGRLVLISGEAGIGKTTLTGAFTDEAVKQGALVFDGYCYDLSTTPPYGLWNDLADRSSHAIDFKLVPEFDQHTSQINDISSPNVVFEHVRNALISLASDSTAIIVLEDLHWADPASLELLRYLARQFDRLPLLIIATYRDSELTRDHPLFRLIPLLVRESPATRIELTALDQEHLCQLVRSRWSLAPDDERRLTDHLMEYAEGNPFFTVELLRTLEQNGHLVKSGRHWELRDLTTVPVPPLVEQAIETRLSWLDDSTRHYLEIASVIGHKLDLDILQNVAGIADDELIPVLDQLFATNVLDQSGESTSVQFDHALTRETLYRSILPPRARIWHRLTAEALIAVQYDSPDEIAYHLEKSGDHRAMEWLIRAGLDARRAAAWVSASQSFAKAAGILQHRDQEPRVRAWLYFYSAYLLRYSQSPVIPEYLAEAERIAAEIGDPAIAAFSEYHRGSSECIRGMVRSGLPAIERGVEALEMLFAPATIPRTDDIAMANISSFLTERDPGEIHAPTDVDYETGSRVSSTQRGVLINWLMQSGRVRDACSLGAQFISDMKRIYGDHYRDHSLVASGHVGYAAASCAIGKPDRARTLFSDARAGFLKHNDFAMVAFSCWVELLMCHLIFYSDRFQERAELESRAQIAWQSAEGATLQSSISSPVDCLMSYVSGTWLEARQHATELLPSPVQSQSSFACLILGAIERHCGQPDLARGYLNEVLTEGPNTEPGSGHFLAQLPAQSLAIQLSLDEGDLDGAHRWLTSNDSWLQWSGAEAFRPENRLNWARYARKVGNAQKANRFAQRALMLAREPRQPAMLIEAHRFVGELATELGNHEDAEQHLRTSLDLALACAMPFQQALTNLAFAELEACRGNVSAARRFLADVRAVCVPLGASPTLELADELDANINPESEVRKYGLTPRELDVLRLIARGMSDREIADELYVSPHTVRRHLSGVLSKLDVPSRTAAASLAMRDSII
jgi:DNA-binding CsgD family transcriptional regulator/tetratricopeptide (TPR) repeat protein